jgi:hypothetical protein
MTVVYCKREPYDVYTGRGRCLRTGEPGRWGNPFSHRPSQVPGVTVVATRDQAIAAYADWLHAALAAVPGIGLGLGGIDALGASERLLGASPLQARRAFRLSLRHRFPRGPVSPHGGPAVRRAPARAGLFS